MTTPQDNPNTTERDPRPLARREALSDCLKWRPLPPGGYRPRQTHRRKLSGVGKIGHTLQAHLKAPEITRHLAASVVNFSMSLDGYIAGPNDEPANPGGEGFDRLHEWYVTKDGEFFRPAEPAGRLIDEVNGSGALLTGRRTAEQADHWGGDVHGAPIFVMSHRPPGPSVANYPLVRYVNDGIESAMAQAKAAAVYATCRCTARTRRSGRSKLVWWTSCRST